MSISVQVAAITCWALLPVAPPPVLMGQLQDHHPGTSNQPPSTFHSFNPETSPGGGAVTVSMPPLAAAVWVRCSFPNTSFLLNHSQKLPFSAFFASSFVAFFSYSSHHSCIPQKVCGWQPHKALASTASGPPASLPALSSQFSVLCLQRKGPQSPPLWLIGGLGGLSLRPQAWYFPAYSPNWWMAAARCFSQTGLFQRGTAATPAIFGWMSRLSHPSYFLWR